MVYTNDSAGFFGDIMVAEPIFCLNVASRRRFLSQNLEFRITHNRDFDSPKNGQNTKGVYSIYIWVNIGSGDALLPDGTNVDLSS